jgi:histidine triad (HIT) family protein
MATVFSHIIAGELPAVFVWRDPQAVAFLSINPVRPGHTLVVPTVEVDHWLDLEPEDYQHLMSAAQEVGRALQQAYQPRKVAMLFLGLEVPHVHAHLIPIDSEDQVSFANAERDPDPAALEAEAARIRQSLTTLGSRAVAT